MSCLNWIWFASTLVLKAGIKYTMEVRRHVHLTAKYLNVQDNISFLGSVMITTLFFFKCMNVKYYNTATRTIYFSLNIFKHTQWFRSSHTPCYCLVALPLSCLTCGQIFWEALLQASHDLKVWQFFFFVLPSMISVGSVTLTLFSFKRNDHDGQTNQTLCYPCLLLSNVKQRGS